MTSDVRSAVVAALLVVLTLSIFALARHRYNKRATKLARQKVISNDQTYMGYNPFTDSDDQCGDKTVQTCSTGDFAQARLQIDGKIDYNVDSAIDDPTFNYNEHNTFDGQLCDKIISDSVYDGEKFQWNHGNFVAAETRTVDCYLCKSTTRDLDSNGDAAKVQMNDKKECRGPVKCTGQTNSPTELEAQLYYSSGDSSKINVSNNSMYTRDLTVEYILGGAYPPAPLIYWHFAEHILRYLGETPYYPSTIPQVDSDSVTFNTRGVLVADPKIVHANSGIYIGQHNHVETNIIDHHVETSLSSFTIWLHFKVSDTLDSNIPLLSLDVTASRGNTLHEVVKVDNGAVFTVQNDSSDSIKHISANDQHQVALVVKDGFGTLYADGIEFGFFNYFKSYDDKDISNIRLILGNSADSADSDFDSSQAVVRIDEIGVWDTALTEAELVTMAKQVDSQTVLTGMPHDKGSLTACGATPTTIVGRADSFNVKAVTVSDSATVSDIENSAAGNALLAPLPIYTGPTIVSDPPTIVPDPPTIVLSPPTIVYPPFPPTIVSDPQPSGLSRRRAEARLGGEMLLVSNIA